MLKESGAFSDVLMILPVREIGTRFHNRVRDDPITETTSGHAWNESFPVHALKPQKNFSFFLTEAKVKGLVNCKKRLLPCWTALTIESCQGQRLAACDYPVVNYGQLMVARRLQG